MIYSMILVFLLIIPEICMSATNANLQCSLGSQKKKIKGSGLTQIVILISYCVILGRLLFVLLLHLGYWKNWLC